MINEYEKLAREFEKVFGSLADYKGTREEFLNALDYFSHGWEAGKAFQQSVQRTAATPRKTSTKSKAVKAVKNRRR
jgi:hypothetical protein